MIAVFDTYVNSVLSYGAEIWVFYSAVEIEKVHMNFCKKLLGVRKTTRNDIVYHELGR